MLTKMDDSVGRVVTALQVFIFEPSEQKNPISFTNKIKIMKYWDHSYLQICLNPALVKNFIISIKIVRLS
jgi:hypothetical protein